MSLSNSHIDSDIRVYIEGELRIDRKLSRWPDSLKRDIRDALVKGANGMFRWVACQLEILGTVNSRPEIRKALRELPTTLEDTYERILTKIPPSNQSIAHKALQIISVQDFIAPYLEPQKRETIKFAISSIQFYNYKTIYFLKWR
ncbi:hypothetical protein NA56DRAFT_660007 [Hyaloscypha hepaticicola]|uniref:Uncharacterized protein n=1 Tax=Hyaloscypha hepaticicola TaxID=2082293 RepID=A0A2J6Q1E6_9HELO|nr:hypothetical protein NA56DRAFT_660007 [Hyaloscypha hepaticicola]